MEKINVFLLLGETKATPAAVTSSAVTKKIITLDAVENLQKETIKIRFPMLQSVTISRPEKPVSSRSFGLLFAGVFLLIFAWPLFTGQDTLRWWVLLLSAVFAVIAMVRPQLLNPLSLLWMRLGAVLHRVVNPLVLGIVYVVVLIPTSFCMRLFSKDVLHLRLISEKKSYWIERHPPGPDKGSMSNQF